MLAEADSSAPLLTVRLLPVLGWPLRGLTDPNGTARYRRPFCYCSPKPRFRLDANPCSRRLCANVFATRFAQ